MIMLLGAVIIGIFAIIDWLFRSNVFTLNVLKLEPIQMHLYGLRFTQMSDVSASLVDDSAPLNPNNA
jgi:hypothetical protein